MQKILFIFLSVSVCFAEDFAESHESTTTPPDARYEIVQSQLTARNTFRLDRFTGNVALLVRTNSGGNAWDKMEIENLPIIEKPTKARFQIFASGLTENNTPAKAGGFNFKD